MKIATVPSKKRKELTIIAILLIGIPLVVFATYQVYNLITRASVEAKPNNVLLSNLTTSSVTVSWVTDVTATGSVIPVVNSSEKSPVVDKRGSGKRYTHYVELTNLEPNTDYQFIIVSDSKKYSSEGSKNFTFKTAPITADTPTPNPVHGSVNGGSGDDVMMYALLKDKSTYPVSAVMPTGGNWIMDLSALRKVSDKSLVVVSGSTNIVIIAVSGPNRGAVVEGSYSDLFDSNGKLKDVHPLTIGDNSNLYTYFPAVAMLEAYSIETPTTPTPTPSYTPTTPVEEEEEEEEEIFDRRFRIVHDINWIDMVTGDGTAVTANTGAPTVQVTNLTDTGFTVIWVSEEKEEGYISYGTSASSLSSDASDERDGLTNKGSYYVHSVSLSRLQPDTTYYFEVKSGEDTYDNGGSKYSVETFSTLSSPPPFQSVTGVVEGMPDHNEAIAVAYIKDGDDSGSKGESNKVSTLVDESGKWILSIADSRVEDGSSYFEYTSGDSMYIDILSTVSTDTATESMASVTEGDIETSLGVGSSSSVGYTRVELLGNYGILGYTSGTNPDLVSDPTDPSYSVGSGTETPKTGIFDNVVYLILLSLGLLTTGVLIYRSNMTKPKRKGKMVRSL
jgi:hypothetical protein